MFDGQPGLPGPGIMQASGFSPVTSIASQSLVIRKEFPETWILDMLNITDDRFVA